MNSRDFVQDNERAEVSLQGKKTAISTGAVPLGHSYRDKVFFFHGYDKKTPYSEGTLNF